MAEFLLNGLFPSLDEKFELFPDPGYNIILIDEFYKALPWVLTATTLLLSGIY